MTVALTTEQDAAYRRGTVLGLTVAEVFILLLFLVLIVLFALVRDRDVERRALQDAQSRLQQAEGQLQVWQDVIEEFEAPKEIETLRRQKEAAQVAAERERQRAEGLREALETSGESAAIIDEALAEAARARSEAREAQRELQLLRTKGVDPPCWYQVVPTGTGENREKPHYTFNIAVRDEAMIVLPRPIPSGGAFDDGDTTYAEEARTLNLASLPYGEPLDDATFNASFGRIAAAGKNERVRSYSCVFWVQVWDQTSPDAKRRWQRANDGHIEGLFGAYRVKDDPWPGQ